MTYETHHSCVWGSGFRREWGDLSVGHLRLTLVYIPSHHLEYLTRPFGREGIEPLVPWALPPSLKREHFTITTVFPKVLEGPCPPVSTSIVSVYQLCLTDLQQALLDKVLVFIDVLDKEEVWRVFLSRHTASHGEG